MRIVRLRGSGTHGELSGDRVHLLDRAPWDGGRRTGESVAFDETAFLAPVSPRKIVCVGRNYAAHAKELGHEVPSEPLLFLKATTSLLDPGGAVLVPAVSSRVEHEAELGVVIGKRAKHVDEASALSHVFGYVPVCDVTARDLQKKDVQFTRAKSFDTFCPVGPWIETDFDPSDVEVIGRVDGEIRQHGRTRDMIFPVAAIVSYISRMMTLEPGDLIATGTPEGVGPLVAGNVLEVEIGGLGTLRVTVADEVTPRS